LATSTPSLLDEAIYRKSLDCVHCGLCLNACPTYRATGRETSSPRGRIYLMRGAAEGRVPLAGLLAEEAFLCVGCRACETACPSGVEFGSMLELTREAVALKSGAGSCLAPTTLPVDDVVRLVAAFFGKRPEALASRSRRRDVLVPRQLAMYLAHRYTDASMTEIGRALGRDHPSVRNAVSRIERLVLENAPLRYQIEALSERIDERLNRNPARGDGASA